MRTVKNEKEAWDTLYNTPRETPSGSMQWKGTDVCMDVLCQCGKDFHIDGWFAYFVECPHCHTVYMCNPRIELVKVEERPEGSILTEDLEVEE
jgi:hypothetical protein